jgi:hypothetical protein
MLFFSWKVGMKLLRDYKLPPGVPRVNAAGLMYIGDLKVSMLVEDEGMLYEVGRMFDMYIS